MKDASTAALIGAVIGYLVHGQWPAIEWLVRLFTA